MFLSFFLQFSDETGRLKRTMLVPGSSSSHSITVDLDPVSATQQYMDVAALSDLLVATVRYDQNQNTGNFFVLFLHLIFLKMSSIRNIQCGVVNVLPDNELFHLKQIYLGNNLFLG